MRPLVTYWQCDSRINETWAWFCAVCAYDFGDVAPLAELIRTEDAPQEYRGAVADIVAGVRKPNKRAAAKLKLPAAEMMQMAACVEVVIGIADDIKVRTIAFGAPEGMLGAKGLAWVRGEEPIDVIRRADAFVKVAYTTASSELGVSIETIENLVRELRRRISMWPHV